MKSLPKKQQLQEVVQKDWPLARLLEVEISEHLRGEASERTDRRRGWRNGHYE